MVVERARDWAVGTGLQHRARSVGGVCLGKILEELRQFMKDTLAMDREQTDPQLMDREQAADHEQTDPAAAMDRERKLIRSSYGDQHRLVVSGIDYC